jgi:hypothetical protein
MAQLASVDPQPSRKAAASHRSDHRVHVGKLGEDLARQHPAISRDDPVIVEGRSEAERGICCRSPAGLGLGFVVGRTHDFQPRAQRQDAVALTLRSLGRDQHLGLHAERAGRQRYAQPVVACRGGDDPLLSHLAHPSDEGRSPAQLERAGSLQRFEF